MVSFELGKETEEDVFRFVTCVGQRKNSKFPRGIEPQTFGFRALSSDALSLSHRDSTVTKFI